MWKKKFKLKKNVVLFWQKQIQNIFFAKMMNRKKKHGYLIKSKKMVAF